MGLRKRLFQRQKAALGGKCGMCFLVVLQYPPDVLGSRRPMKIGFPSATAAADEIAASAASAEFRLDVFLVGDVPTMTCCTDHLRVPHERYHFHGFSTPRC